ncbi:dynamin family protein [Paenibacillus gallinarum]|uniref:Dynamin family protein n=1 Tax=Paenibacillus gallinarum TaxID=2762232 RepID=A0ABR8SX88_9BACL|nr:dynamin family protein [Paenibacillus gallinarum]MBD7968110.1 dynamin family protein [Paenibacillus gallinarum]
MLTHRSRQNEEMRERLQELQQFFIQHEDKTASSAMEDLLQKAAVDEVTIAFCGHFSAGKSSLINSLCGKKVLPASPVPTSANVVAIRNGQKLAKIYQTQQEGEREFSSDEISPIVAMPEELDEYCKNGEQYSYIEVWDEVPLLQEHAVLLDTPGVDSTDDAHKKATDSALHLADAVFYVMDYNHVQSENNLSFAKSLSDWGKPLYLVVTQIDKHREQELSFSAYRSAVEEVFAAWEVTYAGLLFTTLKQKTHPYNQWNELVQLVKTIPDLRSDLIQHSIASSTRHVGEEFVKNWEAKHEDRKVQMLNELGGEEGAVRLASETSRFNQEIAQIKEMTAEERKHFRTEADQLLSSANITPADVRSAAESYLESRRPGFKVGFLFSSGKTEQEKETRLQQFWDLLTRQADGQIAFHLRSLLRGLGQSHGLWNEEWNEKLEANLYTPEVELITKRKAPDTQITGEYVLNYCKDLRADLIASYRRSALELADALLHELSEKNASVLVALEEQRKQLDVKNKVADQLSQLEQHIQDTAAAVRVMLPAMTTLTSDLLPEVSHKTAPVETSAVLPGTGVDRNVAAPEHTSSLTVRKERPALTARRYERLSAAATRLREAAAHLAPYSAMNSAVRGLNTRAASFAGGTFTLALFGAFSAGKSSFASALLGEAVLPVSPHPTTAAINRIMAPPEGMTHRTAQVTMKSKDSIWADLSFSFNLLGLGVPEEKTWRAAVGGLTPQQVHPAGRPHYSFLKAAARGYDNALSKLGQSFVVNMDEYRAYVAEESRSCFVESIDLYYSCDLTNQGIIIVDTPGADSINARHTGVTFNYMKNADALVFITYYNHAFSQGDRQFLNQLGRVKDTKSLDNMFFVINAADLAASSEELELVKDHVSEKLQQNGVRSPHLYAVSSLQALDAKQTGNEDKLAESGFTEFEQAFSTFAGEELLDIALLEANNDILIARKRVEQWVQDARQGAEAREHRKVELEKALTQGEQLLQLLANQSKDYEIAQETQELIFHTGQRIGYRISEFMSEAFHPSVLREDAGDLKAIFISSGRELLRMLNLEMQQELLATSIRLENKGKQLVTVAAEETVNELSGLTSGTSLSVSLSKGWETPSLRTGEEQESIEFKLFWKYFKNPKSFFESNGRKELQQVLEPELKQFISKQLQQNESLLMDYYQSLIRTSFHEVSLDLSEQWKENISGLVAALDLADDSEKLVLLAQKLSSLEQESHI